MIVKVRIQSPAGFEWECVWDSADTLILGLTIDKNQGVVNVERPEGSLDEPNAMDLIEAVIDEFVFCSDFGIVSAQVDDVPIGDEFIEKIYERFEEYKKRRGEGGE